MATSEILTTASVDNGTNLLTQVEYDADVQRPTGQAPGVARSKFINKTLRQLSLVSAVVGKYIADRQATNVTDGLAVQTLEDMLETSLINRTKATVGGTANAITLSLTPAASAFNSEVIYWRATAANSSTSVTVKRDGLAAKNLVKGNNITLAVNDIPGAALMASYYDSVLDKEVLLNPATGVTSAGGIVLGTPVATTSGTSFTFTGIPSNAQEVCLYLNENSFVGVSDRVVRLGSGSVQTTGYKGSCTQFASGSSATYNSTTSGFELPDIVNSADWGGMAMFRHMGANVWTGFCGLGRQDGTAYALSFAGTVALSGPIDRICLTTFNGTDVFDKGTLNYSYQV